MDFFIYQIQIRLYPLINISYFCSMKYKILILLSFPLLMFGCVNESTKSKSEIVEPQTLNVVDSKMYESTLTLTINGDGFVNKTLVYKGIPNNTTYLWAVHYFEKTEANPEGYSYAQLYINERNQKPLPTNVENSILNIAFSGNLPINEKVSGGGLANIATGRGRGIDLYIKLSDEESTRVYYMDKEKAKGNINVTEYGERVKGTFSIQNLQRHNMKNNNISITGSFDLAYLGKVKL